MAQTLARSIRHLTGSHLLSKRLFSSSVGFCASVIRPSHTLPTVRRSLLPFSYSMQSITSPTRFTSIRCRSDNPGNSSYSPLKSGSNLSDRPPNEMAPLFPGCDYEHWLIVMDKPGGEGATKQQMIDCYVQTLAKIVGR